MSICFMHTAMKPRKLIRNAKKICNVSNRGKFDHKVSRGIFEVRANNILLKAFSFNFCFKGELKTFKGATRIYRMHKFVVKMWRGIHNWKHCSKSSPAYQFHDSYTQFHKSFSTLNTSQILKSVIYF